MPRTNWPSRLLRKQTRLASSWTMLHSTTRTPARVGVLERARSSTLDPPTLLPPRTTTTATCTTLPTPLLRPVRPYSSTSTTPRRSPSATLRSTGRPTTSSHTRQTNLPELQPKKEARDAQHGHRSERNPPDAPRDGRRPLGDVHRQEHLGPHFGKGGALHRRLRQ